MLVPWVMPLAFCLMPSSFDFNVASIVTIESNISLRLPSWATSTRYVIELQNFYFLTNRQTGRQVQNKSIDNSSQSLMRSINNAHHLVTTTSFSSSANLDASLFLLELVSNRMTDRQTNKVN